MKLEVYKEISRAKNCLLIGSSKYYKPIVLCEIEETKNIVHEKVSN